MSSNLEPSAVQPQQQPGSVPNQHALPFVFGVSDLPEDLRAHLAAIVESSDDAIISKDLSGIIRSWNRGAQRLFGYTPDEIIGQHISTLTAPEVLDEIPNILRRIASGERIDHYETRRKTKDGRILAVSLTISPIRDASGAVIGASKIARDITPERRFAELQTHLAAIVESSDDAIISKDLDGIIRSWNRGAERIFGYTSDEIVGKHITTLAAPDVIDEIPNILARISAGQRIDHYLTRRKAKDGRILSISITVSPIRDASGRIIGASKIARDVTEQQSFDQALRSANESLARSNADLEQFAYSASHDLQEPLRMVIAYSELLQQRFASKLGPVGDQYIGYIVEGATRMEQLLHDLRNFTRASAPEEPAEQGADTGAAMQRAISSLRSALESSGGVVTHGELPRLFIRDFQLEQIFLNLIGNAIRYRSAEPPHIHISSRTVGTMCEIAVHDNGIGIDPQYKEQIFGIFKRLHSSAEYPGTGMGLAICQRIVERAGGRIWVESRLGEGATFRFTVPTRSLQGSN